MSLGRTHYESGTKSPHSKFSACVLRTLRVDFAPQTKGINFMQPTGNYLIDHHANVIAHVNQQLTLFKEVEVDSPLTYDPAKQRVTGNLIINGEETFFCYTAANSPTAEQFYYELNQDMAQIFFGSLSKKDRGTPFDINIAHSTFKEVEMEVWISGHHFSHLRLDPVAKKIYDFATGKLFIRTIVDCYLKDLEENKHETITDSDRSNRDQTVEFLQMPFVKPLKL